MIITLVIVAVVLYLLAGVVTFVLAASNLERLCSRCLDVLAGRRTHCNIDHDSHWLGASIVWPISSIWLMTKIASADDDEIKHAKDMNRTRRETERSRMLIELEIERDKAQRDLDERLAPRGEPREFYMAPGDSAKRPSLRSKVVNRFDRWLDEMERR